MQQIALLWPFVISVFGGVVWGVQLNYSVMTLKEEVGAVQNQASSAEDEVEELSDAVLRTSLILDNIERRLSELEK